MDADEIVLKQSNLPKALEEKPIITKMLDNSLTLLWIPSIPEQPRFPVSYVVEFSKMSDGMWVVYHESKPIFFLKSTIYFHDYLNDKFRNQRYKV